VVVRFAIFINFPRVITITIRLHLAPSTYTHTHTHTTQLTQANKSVLALFMHITHLHERVEWKERGRLLEGGRMIEGVCALL